MLWPDGHPREILKDLRIVCDVLLLKKAVRIRVHVAGDELLLQNQFICSKKSEVLARSPKFRYINMALGGIRWKLVLTDFVKIVYK